MPIRRLLASMSIACPKCGRFSPDSALACDCGFRFDAGWMPTNDQILRAQRVGMIAAATAAIAVAGLLFLLFGWFAVGAYRGHAGMIAFPAMALSLIVPTVAVAWATKLAYRRWLRTIPLTPPLNHAARARKGSQVAGLPGSPGLLSSRDFPVHRTSSESSYPTRTAHHNAPQIPAPTPAIISQSPTKYG